VSDRVDRVNISEILWYELEGVTRFPAFGKAVLGLRGTRARGDSQVEVTLQLDRNDLVWLMGWCAGSLKKFREDITTSIDQAKAAAEDL
jgi:hypothetical protein